MSFLYFVFILAVIPLCWLACKLSDPQPGEAITGCWLSYFALHGHQFISIRCFLWCQTHGCRCLSILCQGGQRTVIAADLGPLPSYLTHTTFGSAITSLSTLSGQQIIRGNETTPQGHRIHLLSLDILGDSLLESVTGCIHPIDCRSSLCHVHWFSVETSQYLAHLKLLTWCHLYDKCSNIKCMELIRSL